MPRPPIPPGQPGMSPTRGVSVWSPRQGRSQGQARSQLAPIERRAVRRAAIQHLGRHIGLGTRPASARRPKATMKPLREIRKVFDTFGAGYAVAHGERPLRRRTDPGRVRVMAATDSSSTRLFRHEDPSGSLLRHCHLYRLLPHFCLSKRQYCSGWKHCNLVYWTKLFTPC